MPPRSGTVRIPLRPDIQNGSSSLAAMISMGIRCRCSLRPEKKQSEMIDNSLILV